MKLTLIKIVTISLAIFSFSACNPEFNVNGSYKTIPAIYGLLDPSETVHLIKINKTFLGDGNALDFAKIPDSSAFSTLDAVIEQLNTNYDVVATYALRDTLVGGKDTGVFYSDPSKYYYFEKANLSPTETYRLKVKTDNGEAVAVAPIIGSASIRTPSANNTPVSLVNGDPDLNGLASIPVSGAFTPGIRTFSYEISFRFYYTEIYMDNSSKEKSIEFSVRTIRVPTTGINSEQRFSVESIQILNNIATRVKVDPNVKKRVIGNFEYIFVGLGEEFANYLEVNAPVSGVLLDKPEYSNVKNGIGIFSSRYRQSIIKPLNENTHKALATNVLFKDRNFCSLLDGFKTKPLIYCQD